MRTETMQKIEEILKNQLKPLHLEIFDDSARHRGHAGAQGGAGHFKVEIVSELFEGKSLLDRHRLVKDSLKDLFGKEVHALQLKTWSPQEPRS